MRLFEQFDWNGKSKIYRAFWDRTLDRPLIAAYGSKCGAAAAGPFATYLDPFLKPEQIVENVYDIYNDTVCYGDALPIYWPNFGPGVVAAMTGICNIEFQSGSIWYEPVAQKKLSEITPVIDPQNIWYKKIIEVTKLSIERLGPNMQTGFTDLGGILDVISSCRGAQNLIFDLIDCPQEVKRLTDEFHKVWWTYYDELKNLISKQNLGYSPWALLWSDKPVNIIQCDFAYMISPAMFREFVLPELTQTISKLERSFFHLDGPGMVPHLDSLLEIEKLDGIQWIAGEGAASADQWTDLIPKILRSGKLVQLIINCEQTLNAIKNFGSQNIMYIVTDIMTKEKAGNFFREVESLCKS